MTRTRLNQFVVFISYLKDYNINFISWTIWLWLFFFLQISLMSFILFLIRRLCVETRVINNFEFNVFDQLLNEFVLKFASWLLYSCVANLALYNHRLFFVLDKFIFIMFKIDAIERDLFLRRLEKDLINTFFCNRCKKFHVRTSNRRRNLTTTKKYFKIFKSRCKVVNTKKFIQNVFVMWFDHHFILEHIQIVTTLFRYDFHFENNQFLECATITQSILTFVWLLSLTREFQTMKSLFIKNKICVRTQTCILFSQTQNYALLDNFINVVCNHLDSTLHDDDLIKNILRCQFRHLRESQTSCFYCVRLLRCRDCYTKIYVTSTTIRNDFKINVINITKWQYVKIINEKCCEKLTIVQRREIDSSLNFTLENIMNAFERDVVIFYTSIWIVKQMLNAIKKRDWCREFNVKLKL